MNRTYWYAGLFLSLLLPAAHADTPFMLLNDADGFVNLRDVHRPDKIIARLHTPQVVASYGEDYPDRMQYHQISYSATKAPAHFRRYAPLNPPGGCALHQRCPHATTRCAQEEPSLRAWKRRPVACLRLEELDA